MMAHVKKTLPGTMPRASGLRMTIELVYRLKSNRRREWRDIHVFVFSGHSFLAEIPPAQSLSLCVPECHYVIRQGVY